MDIGVNDEKSMCLPGRGCVCWSAIIAGALVAFSLGLLLNLLNAGLGLVAFPQTFRSIAGIGVGGYIWLIICAIIAMFIAGFVAGKLVRGYAHACLGLLHGFLAWSLALLLSVIIASHFAASGAQAMDKMGFSPDNRIDAARLLEQRDLSQAEQAADRAGTITLGVFFLFLLGAVAATLGGYLGAKNGHDYPHHHPLDQPRTHTTKY